MNTTKFLKLHEALDLTVERDRQRLIGDDGGDPLAMAAAAQDSGFDKLLSKNVPDIHEKIFFSLDFESFKKCFEVSTTWRGLLTSEPFLKKARLEFRTDIEEDERLVRAAGSGDVEEVSKLLSFRLFDVNRPLFDAEGVHEATAKLFLDAGANPDEEDDFGTTPLIEAAKGDHTGIVQLLIDGGADPNKANEDGDASLLWVAEGGLYATAEQLGISGGEPGWTPLHWAAFHGHGRVVKILLEKGAEPNKGQLTCDVRKIPPSGRL